MNDKKQPDEGVTQDLAKMQDLVGTKPPTGELVDPAFDGAEFVEVDDCVPMDRVHADTLAQEGAIRAQLLSEKVLGLPPRKDPYLLDVLSGKRRLSELPEDHPFWQRHNRAGVLEREKANPGNPARALEAEPLSEEEAQAVFGPMGNPDPPEEPLTFRGIPIVMNESMQTAAAGPEAIDFVHSVHEHLEGRRFSDDPHRIERSCGHCLVRQRRVSLADARNVAGRDLTPEEQEEQKRLLQDLNDTWDAIHRRSDVDPNFGLARFIVVPPETSRWVRFKTWLRSWMPW